jgi:hypothetical protein
MEIHLKFITGQQKRFIENVITKNHVSITYLASISGVSPRNFRDWQNEKINIRKSVVMLLSKKFKVAIPENVMILEKRWKIYKSEKSRVGGLNYYKKYGSPATLEGMKKGGSKTLQILRAKGVIPPIKIYKKPKHSKELAEFVGMMLGDGGITNSQAVITLNSNADSDYISYVTKLTSNLFGETPKITARKDCNATNIYFNGEGLVNYLKTIGLCVGNKVKQQVAVPKWILKNIEYKKECLRGLMDTDGGVFIHKYKVNGKEYLYKKICFTNYSLPLLNFVYKTLKELGFTPKIKDKVVNKKVWLYNSHEVKKYLNLVKSSNFRLNRFKYGGVA